MLPEEWKTIKNFKQFELDIYGRPAWGDTRKIKYEIVQLLDMITQDVKEYYWNKYQKKVYCLIHCAYEASGHATNSKHHKGEAIDFHFGPKASAKECLKIIQSTIERLGIENKCGIGVYPDWINQGFHLDIRKERGRWSRVNNQYIDINRGILLLK